MAEADELWLELGEPPGRLAVALGVHARERERLGQARDRRDEVEVPHDVTRDQHAVGLAPERDVALGVARRVKHTENPSRVAFKLQPLVLLKRVIHVNHALQVPRS